MKSRKTINDYSFVDWDTELNEYFNNPYISIARFAYGKPYSYWAIRDRIRRDPRYDSRRTVRPQDNRADGVTPFLPVIVRGDNHSTIRVNGFELEVGGDTDLDSLKAVLMAMRDL